MHAFPSPSHSSTHSLTIRNAVRADLPLIVEIYNSTIPGRMVTADLEPVRVEDREEWFQGHSGNRPLWVAETEDGKMAGWVSFKSFYGRPAYRHTVEVAIYLHEDFRGKGLGDHLLREIISACPGLEIKTVLGYIFGHNEPSLRLFAKHGFTQWGRFPRVAEMEGQERDLVIVGKRIDH